MFSLLPIPRPLLSFVLLIPLGFLLFCGQGSPVRASEAVPGLAEFVRRVTFLGSDELAGRGTGSPGAEKAAEFIALELRKMGLEPLNPDEGFFQPIPLTASTPLPTSELKIESEKGVWNPTLGRDYLLLRTGAQTFLPVSTPLVFAGYGIVAPEFDYNNYQDLDVTGKVVVILSGEPESDSDDFFAGPAPTVYSNPEAKHRTAIARGARGTVLVPTPAATRDWSWQKKVQDHSFEDVNLAYGPVGALSLMMAPQSAQRLFEGARSTLAEVFEMDRSGDMVAFPLPARISFRGQFRERQFIGKNVAAVLCGGDGCGSESAGYVLLSAHYDGLGIGPPREGDAIYNGVADNAMGVAALLEIAERLARGPRPRRSIVFLFPVGEEKGLLGSRYYVEHPLVPLHRTIANLNIDGIALFDRFRDVIGVGTAYSTLAQVLARCAEARGMQVMPALSFIENQEAFLRSDQVAFAEAGIPSMLVLDGYNQLNHSPRDGLARMRKWMTEVYHSPFDDLSQPIDWLAVGQHVDFLHGLAVELGNLYQEPEWERGSPYAQARLQSIAEGR